MKKYSLLLLLFLFATTLSAQKKTVKKTSVKPMAIASIQSPLKLWYDNPATYFEESLVLGNGMQGATVFGGIGTDKIYLNDLTLWSGEPVNANMNPNAYKNLPDIRKALNEKNYKKAEQLYKKLQGKYSESYAPLGTLYLDMNDDPFITDYYRELDIDNAIAKVKTISNNNVLEREYLVSNPDKIFAIHFTSKKAGALGFTIRFESLLSHTKSINANTFIVNGNAPIKADPNYVGKSKNNVVFDAKKGSAEADELELLSLLIEQYEDKHFPLNLPDPIEAIKFRMEQMGYTQTDLANAIGLKSRASEILNRKRKLTLDMIRSLNEQMNIPIELLVKEY